MKQNILSILFGISTFFLMITCAVAVPIYFRPFYFWHIKALNLEDSGYSAAQIKEAYNEILDYLTLPGGAFHAGDFPFTAEGAAHFTDCKLLFTLNAVILVASTFTIILLLLLQKKKKIQSLQTGRFHPSFYAAITALVLICGIALLASTDFYAAFVTFHSIFFPGKENWILNYRTDPIINVMPQDFFMNCAILIGTCIVVSAVCIIVWQVRKNKHK